MVFWCSTPGAKTCEFSARDWRGRVRKTKGVWRSAGNSGVRTVARTLSGGIFANIDCLLEGVEFELADDLGNGQ